MKKLTVCYLSCLLLALGLPGAAIAQQPLPQGDELVLRVDGLTSAERDALRRSLPADGSLELRYACVPAGILVLGAPDGAAKTALRERARPLTSGRIAEARITEPAMDRAQAEAQCAAQRGQ